jgi:hypothetical protein
MQRIVQLMFTATVAVQELRYQNFQVTELAKLYHSGPKLKYFFLNLHGQSNIKTTTFSPRTQQFKICLKIQFNLLIYFVTQYKVTL